MLKINEIVQYMIRIGRPLQIRIVEGLLSIFAAIILSFASFYILAYYTEEQIIISGILLDIVIFFAKLGLIITSSIYSILFLIDLYIIGLSIFDKHRPKPCIYLHRVKEYILKISRPLPIGFIEGIISICVVIILAFSVPGVLFGYMGNNIAVYNLSWDIIKIFSTAGLSIISFIYLVLFICDIIESKFKF